MVLSAAMSLDGYLDDASGTRLLLSNEADLDRVDGVRAECDAIMVGANTVRRDDPRLTVRSATRRADRVSRGLPPSPTKVTVTASGAIDAAAKFFTAGTASKLVYATSAAMTTLDERVAGLATVVDAGPEISLPALLAELAGRGIGRLMVEGGTAMHTQFLLAGLADELHVVVAPFFVGDSTAPRFVLDGRFPQNSGRRMELAEARRIGDVVLLRYLGLARLLD